MNTKKAKALTFVSNPDQFLCEGVLQRDASGNLVFVPTNFRNQAGLLESRVGCNFLSNWNANNVGSTMVSSPGGSFVTDPCTRGQLGPNRNGGFTGPQAQPSCTSGNQVQLSCKTTGTAPAVLRVCEVSGQLGTGVACTLADAVANVVVGATPTPVTFTCPAVRDAALVPDPTYTVIPTTLPGVGGYSLYRATIGTLSPSDNLPAPTIKCSGG